MSRISRVRALITFAVVFSTLSAVAVSPVNAGQAIYGLTVSASVSLTLSEQRAQLREKIKTAKQQYVNARPYISALPRADGLIVKAAIASGIHSLDKVSNKVTAATTQTAMTAAAKAVAGESRRASTTRTSAARLDVLQDWRKLQQDIAGQALVDFNSGSLVPRRYRAEKGAAAAFSTLLAADALNQRKVIGKILPPAKLRSSGWRDELRAGSDTIPTVSGWTGFPGGCALPTATSAYRPTLPESGPAVATNNELVAAANARASADSSLAPIHAQMLRSATSQAAAVLTLDQLRNNYPARVARLGFGWLQAKDVAARDALRRDATLVLEAGPDGMNSLTASHLLLASSTAADWSSAAGLDETVLIRWIGPQTCLHADRENFVKAGTNIPAIHNSATFTAAAVFLEKYPSLAAALAKESLTSIQPALRMITTDGGTQEGPGYWSYQSRAVSTLYSTLPNVYEINPIAMPSLAKVSNYALNSTGPDDLPTPFADARAEELLPWMPAWDAYSRDDPAVAAWVGQELKEKPDAYLMWWWSKPGVLPAKRTTVYPRTGLAALHLPVGRPPGTATLKGGDNGAGHAHLDLGTVSFHRHGIQWAIDPGADVGYPPGYFGSTSRWKFWKPSTAAHSTLMISETNQPVRAKASTTKLSSSSAVVNMVQALPGASSATRTVSHSSTSMVVKDVVRTRRGLPLTWQWVTDASVSLDLDRNRAVLRKSGERVTIRFGGIPSGSSLTAVDAPEPDSSGRALKIIKLTMPNITSLNLTTTVW